MSRTKKTAAQPAAPTLYKVLVHGESRHGGNLAWSLPTQNADGTWTPGAWHEVEGEVVLCRNGLHLTPDPLAWWLPNCDVYEVEAEGIVGDVRGSEKKVAAKRARLLRKVDASGWRDAIDARDLEVKRDYDRQAREQRARAALRQAEDEARMAESDRIMARRRKKEKAERQAEQAELARVLALSPAQHERERKAGTVPMSPVMQAVKLYRASVPRGSWRRLNSALFDVVRGAIEGHVAFDVTDVRDFFASFDAACWLDAERLYEIAVKERNVSACRSVEHYCVRTPWLVKGQRLATGSALVWEGRKVVVTSFNDEADTFIACSYKVVKRGEGKWSYETDKVDRRFTITRDAFTQAFGAKKAKAA